MSFIANFNQSLLNLALQFVGLGWSVIPLHGDTDLSRPKAPALPRWKSYQRRLPTTQELQNWFTSPDARSSTENYAIGIVLGRVSGVVVLDIDDSDRAEQFAALFPDLIQTFTVQSGNRGLPHYYFQIEHDLVVPARNANGCELRSDGQYVVAPESVINGNVWRITNNAPPKILTERDLRRLLRFLQLSPHQSDEKRSEAFCGPSDGIVNPVVHVESQDQAISPDVLLAYYRSLAVQIGRNNALFKTGCLARDFGYSQDDVEQILASAHATQTVAGRNNSESITARLAEAARTISSVFSRRPRSRKLSSDSNIKGLRNHIREQLLQQDLWYLARVLDGLILAEVKAGDWLTIAEVYEYLQPFGIGRQTIIRALTVDVDSTSQNPPHTPPITPANAAELPNGQIKQCLFDRASKPTKNRGRPAVYYQIPTQELLCECLGIAYDQAKICDPLSAEDLRSPAAYRAALHTALIRRSPRQYPRQWLANRLGISQSSCRRYERQKGIQVQPMFNLWQLNWENVEAILPKDPVPGQFLQDHTGRRFPPLLAIGKQLLASGLTVFFKVQCANHYSVPSKQIRPISSADMQEYQQENGRSIAVITPLPQPQIKPVATVPSQTQTPAKLSAPTPECELATKPEESNCCGPQQFNPGEHQQTVADRNNSGQKHRLIDRLYALLKSLNPERYLTRKRAKQVVEHYGIVLVQRGLRVVQARSNLRNPAGFLLTWLQSEHQSAQRELLRSATISS